MADQAAMHTPCWTELAVPDPEAAKAFYATVFGWKAETDPRPEAAGYCVFKLGEASVAAVRPLSNANRPVAWSVCLAVEDADATVAKAVEHGGRTLMEPEDVFELGRYGVIADPSGAAFAIWQPGRFAGADVMGDPDSLGWIELSARDPKQALAFYPSVFGWSTHLSDFYTEWSIAGTHFGGLVDLNQVPGSEGVPPHWKPYFRVADVDESAARADAAGGRVLLPPSDVPGDDLRISVLRDPQGADFGIFAPVPALAPGAEASA
jgi:predicted enzyme related to lactoylglutathione lyase